MTDPSDDVVSDLDNDNVEVGQGPDAADLQAALDALDELDANTVLDVDLGDLVAPNQGRTEAGADDPSAVEVDLARVMAERDEYLDTARRVQADFENYKRRVDSQRVEQTQRAAESLVVELLPVLDACDAALGHGAEDVVPIQSALYGTLERKGLTRVDQIDVAFDPEVHEAVLTEAGDGGDPLVVEIMRTGYSWNGRVVRPAMVKVRS